MPESLFVYSSFYPAPELALLISVEITALIERWDVPSTLVNKTKIKK
jgi:hypothetical protein